MIEQYIKDDKVIVAGRGSVVIGSRRIFNPTAEQLLEDGWSQYIAPEKSVEQLIQESDERINKETNENILTGFSWHGEQFYLSLENQFNFKNLYDLRALKEYPVLLKTCSGFMQLDNATEVEDFYIATTNHVELCLKTGWIRKAEAADDIRKKYDSNNQ